MPLIDGIDKDDSARTRRLRSGVECTEKFLGRYFQIKLLDDLSPGVVIDQRAAEYKNRGTTISDLMINRVAKQMRFANAGRARDQRPSAVHQTPAIAGYAFEDGIHSFFETAHIVVEVAHILFPLRRRRIDIANGPHRLPARNQRIAPQRSKAFNWKFIGWIIGRRRQQRAERAGRCFHRRDVGR